MKKNVLILLLFLTVICGFAQVKVSPGLRVGANIANLSNTDFDPKTGIYAGAFVSIRFADFYTLQPEITYSQQGGKGSWLNQNEDLKLDYLSFGVANKFYVVKGSGFHLIVGPTLDINVSDNWSDYSEGQWSEDLVHADMGVFFGVGYEFPFGLSLEARYKQGFIDVDTHDNDYDFEDYPYVDSENLQLNSVIQLGLTYKFKF